ncbi:PSD1 and planctomycete cytochrome C domain-containing protein [soil metagenome]
MKLLRPLTTASFALGSTMLFVSAVFAGQAPAFEPDTTPDQIAFFETKIRPVLAQNCFGCHGKDAQLSGLRLDTREGFRKGGEKGAPVVMGDPEKSLMIHAVRYSGPLKMPPGGKLKPAEVADLEAWVKMGAPWPKVGANAPKKGNPTPWSVLPVKKPVPPKVKQAAWVANPIDAFVLAKLEAQKLSPAPPADRRTLIRRVTYDLIGLPPTAEETNVFLADKSPGAYGKIVDRLLASPRYGERWARQWLDVARYADTKGYAFTEDRNYPNAYTYREWVIRAFNEDLPYDRFIKDQLAADLLPEVQHGKDKRPLAALGFLTVGRRFLNSTPDIIDDRIDVTMRGLQAFTVGCARCHDHKFDPIPTQDYYSLYAVFNSSEEKTLPISEKAVREPWERYSAQISAKEGEFLALVAVQTKLLRTKETTLEIKGVLQGVREDTVPDGDALAKLMTAFEPAARERLMGLQREVAALQKSSPTTPEFAMAMSDSSHPGDGVIFKRGNPGNPGDPAPRRFLLALSKKAVEREHWTDGSGRLQLADSIASTSNPLTARVFVNRVWMGHFGAGLVRTPSDFGNQGEKPTHPELLDYLASTFMENGWSIKKLHRLIVMSSTYRQSSDAPEAAVNADPENRLLSHVNRRRLDLEQMRDSLMAASGRLDVSQIGGKSVDLWSQPFTPRRAVYGFIERQNLPGIFRTFDFASPDSTSPRRFQTTVPQQALFFLNSPFSIEQARTLATRPEIVNAKDSAQRLRRLYLRLFARLPDADETSAGLAYLEGGSPGQRVSIWQYGYGGFDGKRVAFTPFSHFSEGRYQVGTTFPDAQLGYVALLNGGGHPGRDAAHAAIRRWIAPATMTVTLAGVLQHSQKPGDGVRARVVSRRAGLLGEWKAHNGEAKTDLASVKVQKGDTLDFIVDPLDGDNSDSFAWSPILASTDGKGLWNAAADFSSPPHAPLTRIALYAQALLMTNEFLFVD